MRAAVAAAVTTLALVAPGVATAAPPEVDGWPTTTPVRAGLDPDRLDLLAREAQQRGSTCFAVVRDGRVVTERSWRGPRTTPRQVFSVTKSIVSALVGIAERDGDLRADDRVARYVRSWRDTPSAAVTVRDLLSNTSGRYWSEASDYDRLVRARDRTAYAVRLSQQHPRGTAWAYNNAAIQVLDRVLRVATGVPTDRFAATRLFGPLGMRHTTMTRDASGRSTNAFFGVHSTCLDLARFARLYLQGGTADGRRVLPRSWVRRSVGRSSSTLNAAYGYLWWVNRSGVLRGATDAVDATGQPLEPRTGQLVPEASPTLYAALGLGGQVAMVDPRSRTIVVRLGEPSGPAGSYGLRDAARVVTWAATR